MARTVEEKYNQRLIIGITTVLLVLCYIFFFLRILSRRLLQTPLWYDDWYMLFALPVCSSLSVLNYVGLHFGAGVHEKHIQRKKSQNYQKVLYILMICWALGVTVVKIGILLFYWRVFSVRRFRRRVAIVGALVLSCGIGLVFSFAFQCFPVSYFFTRKGNAHCINGQAFYMSGAILNILGDALVWTLPIGQVLKLNTTLGQKLSLLFLFGLGVFVCMTSIARLVAVHNFDRRDFSYNSVTAQLWSTIEVQVGYICANLPHTRALAVRYFPCWQSRSTAENTTYHARYCDGGSSGNARPRSHLQSSRSLRPDKAGFQNLDWGRSADDAMALGGSSHIELDAEDASTTTTVTAAARSSSSPRTNTARFSGRNLITPLPDRLEDSSGPPVWVEVQTTVRQEVQRVPSPRADAPAQSPRFGEGISTFISA